MITRSPSELIVGAGIVAQTLASRLVEEGRSPILLSRRSITPPPGARVVVGDARNPDGWIDDLRHVGVVYHCANAPYYRWATDLAPLGDAVLAVAAHFDAKIVVMDNLYMLDPSIGPMRASDPLRPRSEKGRVRAELSERWMRVHARGLAPVSILRASDFYGPGVTKAHLSMSTFQKLIAGKRVQVVGDPSTRHSYSYIEDVAKALATLGASSRADGRVWHCPGATQTSTRELLSRAGEIAGARVRIQVAPRWLVRALEFATPDLRGMTEMLYQFESDFVMDASDFTAEFGDPSTPMDVALSRTIDDARRRMSEGTIAAVPA